VPSARPESPAPVASPLLDERSLSRLRWGCRRGLLENDLFIERFFARHAATLTVRQAKGLDDLMDLSDNDLLDLFLQRKQPSDIEAVSASTDEAREVLALLIVPAAPASGSA
jgi:antitoxin CptB